MRFVVLASGSKGNCIYIETKNHKILVDIGIAYTKAKDKAEKLGIDLNKVDALFLTHSHIDHIYGLTQFLKQTNATIYASLDTHKHLDAKYKYYSSLENTKVLEADALYNILDFSVVPLQLVHDFPCFGYCFICEEKTLMIAIDTGIFPKKYTSLLEATDALVIEANHDIDTLINSDRHQMLIDRILSAQGHMSNTATYHLLKEHLTSRTKVIVLAHVSEECNSDEEIARDIIKPLNFKGDIYIARQYQSLPIIEV
ncbi:MAG TPA: MBL fold metallo-hydrolase [Acholeplasma sp.]|jgi:phosphoribosyl 1,2-cyclic phosphodiesterase|nr:MBL fold metallo-hydrolase [Acholeplasma sp.]